MSKAGKITLPRWDHGPTTLAALGDVDERLDAFKAWLTANPKRAEPRDGETQGEATARAARHFSIVYRGMTVVEPRGEIDIHTGKLINPNGVTGRRRIIWAEKYQREGKLSKRQLTAAQMILAAMEGTQRRPPAIKEIQVDSSPKPDQHIAIQIDRQSRYHAVAKHIPQNARAYIDHVVMQNRSIRAMPGCKGGERYSAYLTRLAAGLEAVADGLGL